MRENERNNRNLAVGMIVSVWIANVSMKKHKGIEKSES